LKQYDEALLIDGNATDILSNKGLLLIQLQKYNEAIAVYDKILSIDHDNVDGLYNKGVALEKLGMTDESMMYKDQALKIDPNYSPKLINRVSESLDVVEAKPSVSGKLSDNASINNETEDGLNISIGRSKKLSSCFPNFVSNLSNRS